MCSGLRRTLFVAALSQESALGNDFLDMSRRVDFEGGGVAKFRLDHGQVIENWSSFFGTFALRVVVPPGDPARSTSAGALSNTMWSKSG